MIRKIKQREQEGKIAGFVSGLASTSLTEEVCEGTMGICPARSATPEATAIAGSVGRSTPSVFEDKPREVWPGGQGEGKVVGAERRGNCMDFIKWGLVGLSKDLLLNAE